MYVDERVHDYVCMYMKGSMTMYACRWFVLHYWFHYPICQKYLEVVSQYIAAVVKVYPHKLQQQL